MSPMVPLPFISEPFRRMAMDIVGPLPRSRSENRFVLVLCDYATRYAEAVPMRTVHAEAVADELVKVFSRVGIPEEILTDQGTNFTDKLLGELYRLLNIKALRTSPFHPQTDGLVERFNGTLKDMLRKTAQEDGKDWDKLLPYLLYREAVQRELEEMKVHKIIEPANSDWAAPMVLVKKKDGTLRLCVDYRRLNTTTQADAYPMPRIEDMIDQLGKAKYLTTLDLTKGYWQVPVAKRDRPKTVFTTPFGLFQFLRMPFGLTGVLATFQRMIDHLLQGLGEFTGAYLDDVVVFSVTWEEHMQHVEAVLTRLREAGLTAKPRKCQFGMAQCVYLGHVVGGGRVWVEESKVGAIQRMPRPQTKKDVRAFLGLSGYYRKFIPGYASIATALSDLTRKAQPEQVIWTADCEEAFGRLKTLLCSAPVLRAPDLENGYVLQTDASNRGGGQRQRHCDARC